MKTKLPWPYSCSTKPSHISTTPSFVIEETQIGADGEESYNVLWEKPQDIDCGAADAYKVFETAIAATDNRLELWYKATPPRLLAWRGKCATTPTEHWYQTNKEANDAVNAAIPHK